MCVFITFWGQAFVTLEVAAACRGECLGLLLHAFWVPPAHLIQLYGKQEKKIYIYIYIYIYILYIYVYIHVIYLHKTHVFNIEADWTWHIFPL